jgi:hypothetical protein
MNEWFTYRGAAVLGALCILGGAVWGITGARDGAKADPRFIVNGETIAQSFRVEQAIPEASERVGFPVRVPGAVPGHLKLKAISTDVAGTVIDQDGVERDVSWNRLASLLYEDGRGQAISISQTPPERSVKLAAGSNPREIDVGDANVAVMVSDERTDAVSVAWDSPEVTYFATYVFPAEALSHSEAEKVLLDMLGSMR